MRAFNESELTKALSGIPKNGQSFFAAAAATRQMVGLGDVFEFPGVGSDEVIDVLNRLWADIESGEENEQYWTSRLSDVMSWLPGDDEDWSVFAALAEDAISSLAYAIRSHLKGDPQESAWSARCAYEAVDQATIRLLGIQPGSKDSERLISENEVVQRELVRQAEDIERIRRGLLDDTRAAAFSSPILQENEVSQLKGLQSSSTRGDPMGVCPTSGK
jgi:hypothetical protein